MTNPFQWTWYIGPAWHRPDSPYFLDWSAYNLEATTNLAYQSTLASTMSSSDTTLTMASGASFPAAGGLWVAPNGSGQAWEYVDYFNKFTNLFTGVVREPAADREHNGVHSSGAVVKQWWQVVGNDGQLRVDMSSGDDMTTTEWQIQVSGVTVPQVAFRQFHISVLQYRNAVTGSLKNLFVGFLDASSIQDDLRRVRPWTARILSIVGLLKKNQVDGVRVGDFDAAQHGQMRSSVVLGAAHKERWTGDFVAANPSFAADVVQSDDNDAIWINDRLVGTVEDPASYDGISQIYINPPLSSNAGTKWIEFINHDTASVELWAWDADLATTTILTLPTETLGGGDRMIVAENAERFQAENPSQQAVVIFDVSGSSEAGWFNRLKAHGGAVTFHFGGGKYGDIYWGDVTETDTGWGSVDWNGPSMPAPGYDQTMRWKSYDHGHTNTKDDWEVTWRQSPGYPIQDNSRGEQAWIAVDLPSLGLVLHDDITSTDPASGHTLLIDGQNGPSTDGLPSSGTVVVGDEYISFSAKVAGGVTVSSRGASSTTAAAHVKGDAVLIVFSQASRTTITDALPLTALIWERKNGTIYPKDFKWRYSALQARTPDTEQHEDDFEVTNTITGATASSHTQNLTNNRAKTVLLEIEKMTTDPARPRINRFKAMVDPGYFASANWLSGGETIETLIKQIGLNTGMPSGALSVTAGGATPTGFITAVDKAWSVMASAAELGGSWIRTKRDSKLVIAPDTFWLQSVGSYSALATWDESIIADCKLIKNGGGQVSQVKLTWKTPDESDGGTVVWPATPDAIGAIQEIGPFYFATETGATLAARKRYYLSRYPDELEVTLAAGDISVEPRQIYLVQWPFADDMQPINRLMLVSTASHGVNKRILDTLVHGIVIDRESDG